MSTTSQIARQQMRDYAAETVRLQSCQTKLSGKDGDICGEGQDYCTKCPDCGVPHCDSHSVALPGLEGKYCFRCAVLNLDADDLIEAEDAEEKGKVAA